MTEYIALSTEDKPEGDEEEEEMENHNPELLVSGAEDEGEGDEGENGEELEMTDMERKQQENETGDDDVFADHNGGPDLAEVKGGGDENGLLRAGMASPDSVPKNLHQLLAAIRMTKVVHRIARDGETSFILSLSDSMREELAAHVNELDEKHLTPLHYAARYSHLEMMKLLIELGADVDKKGDDDMTPLHYAARYAKKASASALKALRQHPGRRPSVRSPLGGSPRPSTASHLGTPVGGSPAVSRKNSDVPDFEGLNPNAANTIQFLIEQNAQVNAKDKYGLTALHHASIRGNVSAVNKLLEAPGINKEPRDVQDSTPLHIACTYDHVNVAAVLLREGADPRARDEDQRTPLHEACLEGNDAIVQVLLQEGKERFGEDYATSMLRDRDEEGSTPLLLGVGSGRQEVVKILLDYNANVNNSNKALVYPMHSAARTGDIETLKILVSHGAKLDARNGLLQTPVFLAAQNAHEDVIRFLYRAGADLNLVDGDGLSPLMVAAAEGHADVCQELMDLGARMDIVDRDDRTALFLAAEHGKENAVKTLVTSSRGRDLLEVNNAYDNLPIHVASEHGHVECVQLLLEAGADIDNKNEDEQTPLHLAAINGRSRVVELILRKDRNAVMDEDEDSNTALHLACMNRRAKVVTRLLAYGADVQSRNSKKWTPLDCAAAAGAYKCAKFLLENDAPIDPMDRSKTTPLHLAAENGHDQLILLLLDHGANIAQEDAYGRNLLELAILSHKKSVVRTVLQHRDWRKAMRTTFTTHDKHGSEVPETPLRLLIRVFPDLASLVFDQSVSLERGELTDRDVGGSDPLAYLRSGAVARMDYEFIDDAFNLERKVEESGRVKFVYRPVDNSNNVKQTDEPYDSNGKVVMDNHPLMLMAEMGKGNLLRHPLCLALVRHKWKRFGRYVYYGQLFLYLLFLFFLTSYILLVPNPAFRCAENATAILPEGDTCDPDEYECGGADKENRELYERVSQIGIMALVVLGVCVEIIQFYRAGRRYFQWTNLFDWIVYILSLLFVVDIRDGSVDTGARTCWQWQVGAMVVVLAWLNLLGDIRQLPFLGIYVIMFFDILKTFLRFVTVFIVFIVAFALGFHALLVSRGDVWSSRYAVVKTTVMMLGEYEYEANFFPPESLPYPSTTNVLFVIFIVVMAIIISNLLVGLAVDDIKAVQDQAVLKRLAMQVDLVLDVERTIPTLILRRMSTQIEKIERKRRRWWSLLMTDVVSSRSIVADLQNIRQSLELQDVLDKQTQMEDNIKSLKSDLKSVAAENVKIREMLSALVEHQNISLAAEDEF